MRFQTVGLYIIVPGIPRSRTGSRSALGGSLRGGSGGWGGSDSTGACCPQGPHWLRSHASEPWGLAKKQRYYARTYTDPPCRYYTSVWWNCTAVHFYAVFTGNTLCLVPVMNGHTSCMRLLLEDSDNADLVDTVDSQGQWVIHLVAIFLSFFLSFFIMPQGFWGGMSVACLFTSLTVLVLQIMGSVAWQAEIINCSQIKLKKTNLAKTFTHKKLLTTFYCFF